MAYVKCKCCGYKEEANKTFFLKVMGGVLLVEALLLGLLIFLQVQALPLEFVSLLLLGE
jgi:hypothetical protein